MSESNNSCIEAEVCVRKVNSCDDSQDRRVWLVLAESWLLLGKIDEIVENRNRIEANKGKPVLAHANTAQYRVPDAFDPAVFVKSTP